LPTSGTKLFEFGDINQPSVAGALDMHLDLSQIGTSSIQLSFDIFIPLTTTPVSGVAGIFVSETGGGFQACVWKPTTALTLGSWNTVSFDLTQRYVSAGLAATNNFVVRFQAGSGTTASVNIAIDKVSFDVLPASVQFTEVAGVGGGVFT